MTPDAADLEELFAELGGQHHQDGATDIKIDEMVNADFVITSILPPNKGSAAMVDARTLR